MEHLDNTPELASKENNVLTNEETLDHERMLQDEEDFFNNLEDRVENRRDRRRDRRHDGIDDFEDFFDSESSSGDNDSCPFFCRRSLRRTLFCRWEYFACRRPFGRLFFERCPFECRRAMRVARLCLRRYDGCDFDVFRNDFF